MATIEFHGEEMLSASDYASHLQVSVSRYPAQTYSLAMSFTRPEYIARPHAEVNGALRAPRWLIPVMSRLNELARLPVGWDEDGGLPVARATAVRALHLLGSVADASAPSPWVVPLSSGGVQLEWHEGNMTIEVALDGEDGDEVYVRDGESEADGPLGESTQSLLAAAVARLPR